MNTDLATIIACPKCGSTAPHANDKLEVAYGEKHHGGDLHIEFCNKCGHIYDTGTWVE